MSRHYIQEFREFVKQSPYGTTYEWLQHINAENKQGNITTEECREIIDSLNLKSYEGGKKVLVMWRPEYLGNAGNMLLKLIEEPPADTILILVAENADHILATIKSRTQDIKLAPIPAADIALALSSRNMTDPRRAAQVAHIAMGSYTEALRLVRHADNDLFPDVKNLFNVIFTGNGLGIGKFVNDWSQVGREQQKNFLQYVIQLLEQAIRVRYRPEVLELLPEGESQFVKKLADMQITVEGIAQMSGTIGDTIYFIERNGHAKTQLHALALRLVYIVKGVAVPV